MRLLILLSLIGITANAQDYKTQIAEHRESYKKDFIANKHSPLKEADLKHLQFYDADSSYSIVGNVFVLGNQKPFNMPTYDGTSKQFTKYALVSFEHRGKTHVLTLYRNVALLLNPLYKNLLFLPFTDRTNGKETYGGGRYIDLNINSINEAKIVIDFNKSYNPYCAYSDGYRCPIPPEENDLPITIEAGEKKYTGAKKQKPQ